MTDNPPPKTVGQKLKSFEGIFGLVLLGVSILGLIFTLTLSWYSYEIKIEEHEDFKITYKESYKYSELDDSRQTFGSENEDIPEYYQNGALYVLTGFIILIILCLIFLVGLFSETFSFSVSMIILGVGREGKISSRHFSSLKAIAAFFMWLPTVFIVYGSSRFIGYTRMSNMYLKENSKIPEFNTMTGSYSTVAGYTFFFLGLLMLGGLIFYIVKLWLIPIIRNVQKGYEVTFIKRSSLLISIVVILLTFGFIFMPMFSMLKREYRFDYQDESVHIEYYDTDGWVHSVVEHMEEDGEVKVELQDISTDLALMQWTLLFGLILGLLSLVGIAIYLAEPNYKLAQVMQLCICLLVISTIIFLITHIMLWTDIPDLDPTITFEGYEYDYSFGSNYFPFIFSLLALAGSVWASIIIIPHSIGVFKGVDYGEVTAFGVSEAITPAEGTPRRTPFAGIGRGIKAHKKPVFISIGAVVLIVAGIIIYSIAVPEDESNGGTGNDNAGVPGDLSGYVFNNGGDSIQGYADETSELTTTIYIEPVNVAVVDFMLYWNDEPDADPRHTNEPDSFSLVVESPDGSYHEEISSTNSHGQTGLIVLEFLGIDPSVPPEEMPYTGGTGDWQITISVNSGDQKPIIPGPGNLRTLQDRGNEFSMEISYDYYTLPEEG